ncbi:dual specificity protein phosphatase family protein [Rhodobacterales bacterium]|nr:dual specificity protein phosphatase family protein [Rhodobacterales bacterium]
MTNKRRLGIPDHVPEAEAREDDRPLLFPVIEGVGPHEKTLYLGNLAAAENAEQLMAVDITETLNVSINMFPGPLILPDGVHVRRYQIGMIDGAGNSPYLMAAAVHAVEGLMRGYVPAKPHYPKHRKGNILVHCRGGRSRSVALIALWLATFAEEGFGGFEAALVHLRTLRGLDDTYPLIPMLALARDVLERKLLVGQDGGQG